MAVTLMLLLMKKKRVVLLPHLCLLQTPLQVITIRKYGECNVGGEVKNFPFVYWAVLLHCVM